MLGALGRDGFYLHRQAGSHMHYKHDDGRRVTVAFHGAGSTFRLGLLRLMIQEQAKWTEEDLRRLGLM
jgi:predicted RNA binding protein YcfA (HicA-like mRNA interferase family)